MIKEIANSRDHNSIDSLFIIGYKPITIKISDHIKENSLNCFSY